MNHTANKLLVSNTTGCVNFAKSSLPIPVGEKNEKLPTVKTFNHITQLSAKIALY